MRPFCCALLSFCALVAQVRVPTYHNDNSRTGQNLDEYLLSPANVKPGAFGKRFEHLTDGSVLTQPLYLPAVTIPGKGVHDVVYVTTANNSVYAFDADSVSGSNADPLWQVSFLDSAKGVAPVPSSDVNCGVIWPKLGIVGTPVIDSQSLTMYLVAETKEPGPRYVFRLHALDAASGAEWPGSPVEIQAPGFVPFEHKQRGALLLSQGMVYAAWGSHCDIGDYHGWVMAYDAQTLRQTAVFNVSPNGEAGSFWNGGAGPAADAEGNIYVMSANGTFDASSGGLDYGDSFLKLSPAPVLAVLDYFTPFNQSYLNLDDVDLGSSGAVLLPDEVGSSQNPHLMVGAGKEGRLYLLDRDHMGHAQFNLDSLAVASLPDLGHSMFGSMAYFSNSLYIATEYSPLRAYAITNATVASLPNSQTLFQLDQLGAVPSISANGAKSGIVWILPFESAGAIQAYDASDLSKQLYASTRLAGDAPGSPVEFSVPTIADGKVFVGTAGSLVAYGLLNRAPGSAGAVVNAASFERNAVAPGGLTTLFGSGLALTTAAATENTLPISLADVSILINGIPAPLLYVSPSQINAQVPYETPPGLAQIVVSVSGAASAPVNVTVAQSAPGIFTDADGSAVDIDADGARNSSTHPAKPGSIVSLYLTGIGPVSLPVSTGAPAPATPLATATLKVSASVGGSPAEVGFAGLAPGYAGLAQVNIKVPPLAPGTYPVVINVGGTASNSAMLAVGGS